MREYNPRKRILVTGGDEVVCADNLVNILGLEQGLVRIIDCFDKLLTSGD